MMFSKICCLNFCPIDFYINLYHGFLIFIIYTVSSPFSVLAIALFICYTSVPAEIEARTEVK